jgi:Carboxypeptidase regulatory-like domain
MKLFTPACFFLLITANLAAQTDSPQKNSPAAPDKDKCTVSGTVLRLDTGEPLKKAKVSLLDNAKSENSAIDITDEKGHFLFEDRPPDSYTLSATKPGFVRAEYGQRKPSDPGAILTLTRGQKMSDLVFKLQRTAVITGRVFDEEGELVSGATLAAIRVTNRGSKREFQVVTGEISTNDLGEYRIFDLEPGHYYLAAVYNPLALNWGFDPLPVRQLKQGYPTTFYPNTIDPSKAQLLTLRPGDEIASMDFRMQPAKLSTVSGSVQNAPPDSSGLVSVYMYLRGSDLHSSFGSNELQSFTSTKDGKFSIHRVPPGSYYIEASAALQDSITRAEARLELEVPDSDVEGVTISFSPALTIQGHVLWESGKQKNVENLMLFLEPTADKSFRVQPREPKPDGSFSLKNVREGDYHPKVRSSNEDCFVKSARLGSTSMVDGTLSIRAGADSPLEITMSCRAPRVTGQVLTADSLPAVGVYVVLVPDAPLRGKTFLYAKQETDQNGNFSFRGVEPGDYNLFSWSSVEEDTWLDSEWLKPYESSGTSVHLEEGDHKSVEIKLIETSTESAGTE